MDVAELTANGQDRRSLGTGSVLVEGPRCQKPSLAAWEGTEKGLNDSWGQQMTLWGCYQLPLGHTGTGWPLVWR